MRALKNADRDDINFFSDSLFHQFRNVLDGQMKALASIGEFVQQKAEVITMEQENLLWEKGLLGDTNPQQLLDTVIFYNGLYFALRSGQEHRRLRHHPSQLHLVEPPNETAYLVYKEDVSKVNQGGLAHSRKENKEVIQHANLNNPRCCIVRLYKLYTSLCPIGQPDNAFYLKPLVKPRSNCWYAKVAYGHNLLQNTVKKLFTAAGMDRHYTNHSLRATAATRLFNSGIDEQLIMLRTGHSSVDAVRSYKRTNERLLETTSAVLNGADQPAPKKTALSKEGNAIPGPEKGLDLMHGVSFSGASHFTVNFNFNH